jgi:hypothetical protein
MLELMRDKGHINYVGIDERPEYKGHINYVGI